MMKLVCYTCNSSVRTDRDGTASGFLQRHAGHRVFGEMEREGSLSLGALNLLRKNRKRDLTEAQGSAIL